MKSVLAFRESNFRKCGTLSLVLAVSSSESRPMRPVRSRAIRAIQRSIDRCPSCVASRDPRDVVRARLRALRSIGVRLPLASCMHFPERRLRFEILQTGLQTYPHSHSHGLSTAESSVFTGRSSFTWRGVIIRRAELECLFHRGLAGRRRASSRPIHGRLVRSRSGRRNVRYPLPGASGP